MDLSSIKRNLSAPLQTAEYRIGVDGFMSYANRSLTCDGKLRCPCVKCVNNKLLSPDDVNFHLLHFGIVRSPDPVSKVLGQDKYSRVRGLGLGVKPSDFVEKSVQPHSKDLNMSSKDESVVLYHLRQMNKLIKKQEKRIKKQGKTIMKLKRKIQIHSDTDESGSDDSDTDGSDDDDDLQEDFASTSVNKDQDLPTPGDNI